MINLVKYEYGYSIIVCTNYHVAQVFMPGLLPYKSNDFDLIIVQ